MLWGPGFKANGAARIVATDISRYRLDAAERFGADHAIDASREVPSLLKQANDNHKADFVIVSTGAKGAMEQAFDCVDRGGTILMFAPPPPGVEISVPIGDLWKDEVTITSTYAGSPDDISDAIELLRSGKVVVKDMITHRFGIADAGKGFELVAKAKDSIKVLIEPQR